MATRAPLVLGDDGLPQRLQAVDNLSVAATAVEVTTQINGESSAAIVIGAPVYASAAGTVKRAQANAKSTSGVIGLGYDASTAAAASGNIQCSGTVTATTTQWDAVAGTTGGLTFSTLYFLDPSTPGKITATPPTTTGQCNVLVGRAISATELDLQITPPILL